MTRDYDPASRRSRIVMAGAALLATSAVIGSVLALDVHYDHEFVQLSRAPAAHAEMAVSHATLVPVHQAALVRSARG